ncbi:hypothetical protein U2A4042630017 [Corynebacterium striatum]|nr:hypothetical protein U2A4042630017 [Corynebacterium striatum]
MLAVHVLNLTFESNERCALYRTLLGHFFAQFSKASRGRRTGAKACSGVRSPCFPIGTYEHTY